MINGSHPNDYKTPHDNVPIFRRANFPSFHSTVTLFFDATSEEIGHLIELLKEFQLNCKALL